MMSRTERRAQEEPDQACLLVYDGQCRLCVGTKQKLERIGLGRPGSQVRFVPYQSQEAKQALGARYLPERPGAAFLVRPTGEIDEGLEAFFPLLPHVPGGRVFLRFLRFPFFKRIAQWGYRVIARHRYRLFGAADSAHTPK